MGKARKHTMTLTFTLLHEPDRDVEAAAAKAWPMREAIVVPNTMASPTQRGAWASRPSDMVAIRVKAALGFVVWMVRPCKKNSVRSSPRPGSAPSAHRYGQPGHLVQRRLLVRPDGRRRDGPSPAFGPRHLAHALFPEPALHGRPEPSQFDRNLLIRLHGPPRLGTHLVVRRRAQGAGRRLDRGGQARAAGRIGRTLPIYGRVLRRFAFRPRLRASELSLLALSFPKLERVGRHRRIPATLPFPAN